MICCFVAQAEIRREIDPRRRSIQICWKKKEESTQKMTHLPDGSLTEIVKSSVHDARLSCINCLDLVFAQGANGQPVVVVMKSFKPLKLDFGPTSQQPL